MSKANPSTFALVDEEIGMSLRVPSQQNSKSRGALVLHLRKRGRESKTTKVKNKGTHSRGSATVWISPQPRSVQLSFLPGFQSPPTSHPNSTTTPASGTHSHPNILSVPPPGRERPISQMCLVRRLNKIPC